MKKLLIITLISYLFMSCGNKKADNSSAAAEKTKSATEIPIYQLDALLNEADQLVGQTVKVVGNVTHTCVHSGKRCFIVGENENVTMRIEAKGEIGGFNRELVGSELEIIGVVRERKLTKEYIDQIEKETSEKALQEDGSAESCAEELNNISQMKEWMKANNKDYYSIYYMDGQDYEIL